ncbi:DUF1456 family protein [Alkalibacterium psychrotolerans]
MNNNDRLVRLRYALDLKDRETVEVFSLGEQELSKEAVQQMLTKVTNTDSIKDDEDEFTEKIYEKACDNRTFESFLNGLIIYKRGQQVTAKGEPVKQTRLIKHDKDINNVLLKKVKIALTLTSDDILDILDETGVHISNSELSAVLRKEGHRNYKECGDRYARNFLKGLALRYRDDVN